MSEEREKSPEQEHETDSTVGDKLDSLLPVPGDSSGESDEPGQVDGPMDELLPAPGDANESDDDASTREEMEVDTSADDVDDFIPLHDDPVNEEPEPSAESGSPGAPPDTSSTSLSGQNTCLICGEEIGDARFCPVCGTEQIPTSKFVAGLAPVFMWSRPLPIRVVLSIGIALTLFALLADNGTAALIISASIVPIILLMRIAGEIGGQSRNDWIQVGMMVLIGAAVGLPISWLANRMVARSWFEGGVVNFGATNFGGVAVETVGSGPVLVWLTNGILLPLIMILVIGAAPAALRMVLTMPSREETGGMLSASVAAGYMIGSATVFYWPLFSEIPPIMSTSQWTLTILGIAVVRPMVWILSGAMIGAVVWRYLRDASLPGVASPAALAIGLPFGYSLLSLAVGPTGLWTSMIVGIAFAGAAGFFHTKFLMPKGSSTTKPV